MASQPTPQPQGPDPGAAGVSPAQQQANPLQQALAQLAKVCETMASQNPLVNAEMMEARGAFVKALQKTMTAARPQQEPQAAAPAPDQSQGQGY